MTSRSARKSCGSASVFIASARAGSRVVVGQRAPLVSARSSADRPSAPARTRSSLRRCGAAPTGNSVLQTTRMNHLARWRAHDDHREIFSTGERETSIEVFARTRATPPVKLYVRDARPITHQGSPRETKARLHTNRGVTTHAYAAHPARYVRPPDVPHDRLLRSRSNPHRREQRPALGPSRAAQPTHQRLPDDPRAGLDRALPPCRDRHGDRDQPRALALPRDRRRRAESTHARLVRARGGRPTPARRARRGRGAPPAGRRAGHPHQQLLVRGARRGRAVEVRRLPGQPLPDRIRPVACWVGSSDRSVTGPAR